MADKLHDDPPSPVVAPAPGTGRSGAPSAWSPLVTALATATALWVVLFGAGVTVETEIARFILAPLGRLENDRNEEAIARLAALVDSGGEAGRAQREPAGPAAGAAVRSAAETSRSAVTTAAVFAADVPGTSTGTSPTGGDRPAATEYATRRERLAAWAGRQPLVQKVTAFLVCLTCYSPINIAILSLLAGLIGGCASSLYYTRLDPERRSLVGERSDTLNEHPGISAVRGLVGYILILAGLYAVFDDPFKSPTTSQYTKLAGFASALAFTLGYDGTRFNRLLEAFTRKHDQSPGQGSGGPPASSPGDPAPPSS